MALGDVIVGAALVVRAVSGERGHLARELVEQWADLRSVVHVLGRERRGDDLARLGIEADVQLSPRPPRVGAVLLRPYVAGATGEIPGP